MLLKNTIFMIVFQLCCGNALPDQCKADQAGTGFKTIHMTPGDLCIETSPDYLNGATCHPCSYKLIVVGTKKADLFEIDFSKVNLAENSKDVLKIYDSLENEVKICTAEDACTGSTFSLHSNIFRVNITTFSTADSAARFLLNTSNADQFNSTAQRAESPLHKGFQLSVTARHDSDQATSTSGLPSTTTTLTLAPVTNATVDTSSTTTTVAATDVTTSTSGATSSSGAETVSKTTTTMSVVTDNAMQANAEKSNVHWWLDPLVFIIVAVFVVLVVSFTARLILVRYRQRSQRNTSAEPIAVSSGNNFDSIRRDLSQSDGLSRGLTPFSRYLPSVVDIPQATNGAADTRPQAKNHTYRQH